MKKIAICLGTVAFAANVFADGTIDMALPTDGAGWTAENGVVTINRNGSYTVTGTTTRNRIVIAAGVVATITLQNASITNTLASPFELSDLGCEVTLRIVGENTLTTTTGNDDTSESVYIAGLQVEGNAMLTIEDSGSLTATGGYGASGIGIGGGYVTGVITINGGNVTATGGERGAGIGGGYIATGGNVTINGGNVTATGGYMGAGIGGGSWGTAGVITITGGSVTAKGGYMGAGIGGGNAYAPVGAIVISSSAINISGGNVTATGGYQAAGIGGGCWETAGTINISGGVINATGDLYCPGIGGYATSVGNGGNITISGGNITATSGNAGAAIGCGTGDELTISGGVVLAIGIGGMGDPAAIGGVTAGNITISGGNVYAIGDNISGGIGGGTGATGGSIRIAGGTVMADSIGIGVDGNTPTTISGGAIIANDINASAFGQAAVITGVSLSPEMMRTMAANTETLHNSVAVYDTVRRYVTELMHDTLYDTIPQYATVGADTIRDTLRTSAHDTLTVRLTDTLNQLTYIDRWRDTVERHYVVYVHDTLYTILWRSEVVHDTLRFTDTVRLAGELYIHIQQPRGAGGQYVAAPDPRATSDGNGGMLITGLTPDAVAVIFDLEGRAVASAVMQTDAWRLPPLPSPCVYLLWHTDRWSRFLYE